MNQITRQSGAVAEISQSLWERRAELQAILPRDISLEQFIAVTLNAINENPYILQAERETLFKACSQCARDGLVPDGNEAYFDVRRRRLKNGNEIAVVNYIPMIGGLRKLIIGNGQGEVVDWYGDVVRDGDDYMVRRGDDPKFEHNADPFRDDERPIIGAYSIAKFRDGTISREFMSMRELMKAKATSSSANGKGADYSPWNRWEERMYIKTVMKRHADRLPKTSVMASALASERAIDHEDAVMLAGAPAAPARRVGRPRSQPAAELPAPNPQSAQPAAERQARTESRENSRNGTQAQTGHVTNASRSNGAAEWDDAQSADNGTQHGGDTNPHITESSTESSASPKRRGRPTNAEVAARQRANMRQHPPRQEERQHQQTEIEGGSEAGDEIDELDKIRIEGEQAYESGIPRDAVPRDYKRADALSKLTAWREGWDAAADDSAGGSQYMA